MAARARIAIEIQILVTSTAGGASAAKTIVLEKATNKSETKTRNPVFHLLKNIFFFTNSFPKLKSKTFLTLSFFFWLSIFFEHIRKHYISQHTCI